MIRSREFKVVSESATLGDVARVLEYEGTSFTFL